MSARINNARKALVSKVHALGVKLESNRKQGVTIRWELAEACYNLRQSFGPSADETKAFLATAATAAMLDESVIRNLVAAFEVRQGLTKAQFAKVTKPGSVWPTDSILALKPAKGDESGNGKVGTAEVTRIITKAEKAGTTNTKAVRSYRHDVAGSSKRTRGNDSDKRIQLAKEIGERVSEMVANGHPYVSLIAGAQLAQDFAGRDVAGAILFLSAQVTTAPATEPEKVSA